MSWTSPLTVPMTKVPTVSAPVSASSGRSTSSAPGHGAARDQHLGHEEVAALEAGADLLEARDQRLEQQRLRAHALLERQVGQLEHARGVAHQRLVVEGLEDLVLGHHRTSFPIVSAEPCGEVRGLPRDQRARARPVDRRRSARSAPTASAPRPPRRPAACTGAPDGREAGLQLVHRRGPAPLANLLQVARQRRAGRDGARREPRQATRRAPARRPRPGTACRAADAWCGTRRPTQFAPPSRKRPSTCATHAAPSSRGTTRFDVSPEASARRCRTGSARTARSASDGPARGVGRRARGPGAGGRPAPAARSPRRSSAAARRAVVLRGSASRSASSRQRRRGVRLDHGHEQRGGPVDGPRAARRARDAHRLTPWMTATTL